jgi:hypothetical protein
MSAKSEHGHFGVAPPESSKGVGIAAARHALRRLRACHPSSGHYFSGVSEPDAPASPTAGGVACRAHLCCQKKVGQWRPVFRRMAAEFEPRIFKGPASPIET